MKPLRIKWQSHPNPECETLHVDVKMPYLVDQCTPHSDGSDEADELASYIQAIPGISGYYISGYELHISRGSVFDWAEIRPLVEQAVMAFVGAEDCVRV